MTLFDENEMGSDGEQGFKGTKTGKKKTEKDRGKLCVGVPSLMQIPLALVRDEEQDMLWS